MQSPPQPSPPKMKVYESFSHWKSDQSPKNQRLIGALQRLIKKVAPELTTTVKWGQGCWVLKTVPKIYIHAEPDHVQLGFHRGSTLKDPKKLLAGKGKFVRFIRARTAKDIDVAGFAYLIGQAGE